MNAGLSRNTCRATLLLMVLLVLPVDRADAQWHSNAPSNQNDEVLAYAAGAALLVGGYIVYRKFIKPPGPGRPPSALQSGGRTLVMKDPKGGDEARAWADRIRIDFDPQRDRVAATLRWSF